MTPEILFRIIIAILVIDYAFGLWLDYLNHRHRAASIPEELEGIP
jgi:hypothetical protein